MIYVLEQLHYMCLKRSQAVFGRDYLFYNTFLVKQSMSSISN